MTFKDHFSGHAETYARARPTYPASLFSWLANLAPSRELAWDAGTGNGQAARSLAEHFARVHATDASREQIAHASPHPRVHFAVEPAERSTLDAGAVDLILVAQAFHWFDMPAFFAEADRVLADGGVLALATYAHMRATDAVDALVAHLYEDVLGRYWPKERVLVETAYASIELPFAEVGNVPSFDMDASFDFEGLVAYLRSWSASQRYLSETGVDAVGALESELESAWGARDLVRKVTWPLTVRCRTKEQK